eukprot:gene16217-biopygen3753
MREVPLGPQATPVPCPRHDRATQAKKLPTVRATPAPVSCHPCAAASRGGVFAAHRKAIWLRRAGVGTMTSILSTVRPTTTGGDLLLRGAATAAPIENANTPLGAGMLPDTGGRFSAGRGMHFGAEVPHATNDSCMQVRQELCPLDNKPRDRRVVCQATTLGETSFTKGFPVTKSLHKIKDAHARDACWPQATQLTMKGMGAVHGRAWSTLEIQGGGG